MGVHPTSDLQRCEELQVHRHKTVAVSFEAIAEDIYRHGYVKLLGGTKVGDLPLLLYGISSYNTPTRQSHHQPPSHVDHQERRCPKLNSISYIPFKSNISASLLYQTKANSLLFSLILCMSSLGFNYRCYSSRHRSHQTLR